MSNPITNNGSAAVADLALRNRAAHINADISRRRIGNTEVREIIDRLPAELRPFVDVPHDVGMRADSHSAKTADRASAQSSGAGRHATTTGNFATATGADAPGSHALAGGHDSKAFATGLYGHAHAAGLGSEAVTAGASGHALTSGDASTSDASGAQGHAVAAGGHAEAYTGGARSHAVVLGDAGKASSLGDSSIAAALGHDSHVMAGEDGALVLRHTDPDSGRPRLKVGYVGEDGIKPYIWYRLHPQTTAFEAHDPHESDDHTEDR